MTSPVCKRCPCAEAQWPKCPHPWYLKQMLCRGEYYAPNLTRHAEVFVQQTLRTKGEAEDLAVEVRRAIRLGTYVAAKDYTPPAPAAPPPTTTAPAPGQTLDAIVTLFETLQIDADVKKKKNSKTNDKANLKRLCRTVVPARPEPLGTWPMAALTLQDLIAFRSEQEGLRDEHLEQDPHHDRPAVVVGALAGPSRARHPRRRAEAGVEAPRPHQGEPAQSADRRRPLERPPRGRGGRADEGRGRAARRPPDRAVGNRRAGRRAPRAPVGRRPPRPETALHSRRGNRRRQDRQPAHRNLDRARRDPRAPLGRSRGAAHKRRAYVFGDPFGGRIKSVDKTWRTTLLRAHRLEPGWTETGDFDAATRARLHHIDLHLHDIRHEAACRWLESRCFDLAQISKRLGHSSVAQTATYLHARDSSLRGAQAAYDAKRQADAEAAEAQAKAAAGLKPGSSPYKVHTNGSAASSLGLGPRLVKSDKSSVKK